jgi:hypothetical protein
MKVLGIMGSPRFGGNSDILLDQALAGARSAGAAEIPTCTQPILSSIALIILLTLPNSAGSER